MADWSSGMIYVLISFIVPTVAQTALVQTGLTCGKGRVVWAIALNMATTLDSFVHTALGKK